MYKYLSKTIMMAAAIVLAAFAQNVTTFTDKRDGKTYKKVTIGKQVWMAENLAYNATGSVCYDNKESNCVQYGRLYTWSAAKTACPAGWHLPSDAEWTALEKTVGGSETAGTKLKSKTGWAVDDEVPSGTDNYGFSALPGGIGNGGNFYNAGNYGYWWSATEDDASGAWYRGMLYNYEDVGRRNDFKTYLFSVRCVQD